MSKAKLIAAKELINEKQYDAARALLLKIDDPTAKKWLEKLEGIAPSNNRLVSDRKTYIWITGVLATTVVFLIVIITLKISNYKTEIPISSIDPQQATLEATQSQEILLPIEGQQTLKERINNGSTNHTFNIIRIQKSTDPSQLSLSTTSMGVIEDLPDELWCVNIDIPIDVKFMVRQLGIEIENKGVKRFLIYRKGLLWKAVPSDSSDTYSVWTETGGLFALKEVRIFWLKAGCAW